MQEVAKRSRLKTEDGGGICAVPNDRAQHKRRVYGDQIEALRL